MNKKIWVLTLVTLLAAAAVGVAVPHREPDSIFRSSTAEPSTTEPEMVEDAPAVPTNVGVRGDAFRAVPFLKHVDEAGSHRTVHLVNGKIDTSVEVPLLTRRASVRDARDAAVHDGYAQYFVHHVGPATAEDRAAVEAHLSSGSIIYVPHNTWLVIATPDEMAAISHEPKVLWIGAYKPEHKVSPHVGARPSGAGPSARAVACDGETHHLRADVHTAMVDKKVGSVSRSIKSISDEVQSMFDASAPSLGAVVKPVTPTILDIAVPCESEAAAADLVASHPLIRWIEDRESFRVANAHAAGITQTFGTTTPFWSLSTPLTGKDQIVGVSDTGFDLSNCMFHDPSVSPPFNTISSTHRKVVSYDSADANNQVFFEDYAGGHGSHCAGSVAGYAYSTATDASAANQYKGMAYEAKLALFDFGTNTGGLASVSAKSDIFPKGKAAGAKIYSNSWGAVQGPGVYTLSSQGVDEYAWDNKDFLALFAASNDGGEGFFSVRAPGTSKNILSVGASMNAYQAAELQYSRTRFDFRAGSLTAPSYIADFGPRVFSTVSATVYAAQSSGCSSVSSSAAGKITILRQGSCDLTTAAKNAEDAGAAAVVFFVDSFGAPGIDSVVNIPILFAYLDSASRSAMEDESGSSGSITAKSTSYSSDTSKGKNNLACFSSRGPTLDGRYKPDMTAPGNPTFSVWANGPTDNLVCGEGAFFPQSGTSMATPTLSGVAALVRQYLVDGYHPTAAPVSGNAVANPSAALVKAMLIHSAVSHTGQVIVASGCDGSTSRSFSAMSAEEKRYYEGFGHAQLDRVLHQTASPSRATKIFDVSAGLTTGNTITRCFNVNSDFKATLVWTDAAGSAASAIQLVNDLDLTVTTTAGTEVGNQKVDATTSKPLMDGVNNVEVVSIPGSVSGSKASVTVTAYNVPSGPQPYALVVSGVGLTDDTGCSGGCVNSCSSQGTCTAGRCACNAGFAGADCSITVQDITIGSSSSVSDNVDVNGWRFYKFTPDLSKNLDVRFTVSVTSGMPVFMASSGSYPTAASATDACSSCVGEDVSTSRHTVTFWVREANLVANTDTYVAVYGYPHSRYSYTSSSSSFSFETAYARYTESAAASSIPSVATAVLACLVALVAAMVL